MNMTLDDQSRQALVKYRMERANETLGEAKLLAKENYYNAALNRLYYACFYAALALLVKHGVTATSHAGVKTMLGLHFVSKGLLALEQGKTFSRLFELRHSSDYDDFVYCDREMAEEYIPKAESFVAAVSDALK